MYTDRIQFWVMDLTQIDSATEEQKVQGLVEWAKAFRANSWDELKRIQNAAVREAAKTMELIITNPSEREILRMRQDAMNDWITMRNSERREGRKEGIKETQLEVAQKLKGDGVDPDLITKYTGLTLSEIDQL